MTSAFKHKGPKKLKATIQIVFSVESTLLQCTQIIWWFPLFTAHIARLVCSWALSTLIYRQREFQDKSTTSKCLDINELMFFAFFFQLQSPPLFSPLEEESARSGNMAHLQCIFISIDPISSATPPVCVCDQGGGGGSADYGWVGGFDVANRRNLKPFISIIAPIIPPLAPQ